VLGKCFTTELHPQALSFLFFFFFFGGSEVSIQGCTLARQALYHLSQPFFVLGIFEIRCLKLFAWIDLEPSSS
jgi:hypothetical protein